MTRTRTRRPRAQAIIRVAAPPTESEPQPLRWRRSPVAPVQHGATSSRAQSLSTRAAANFGPAVVDLGPLQKGGGDRRPFAHGMDVAQLFERSWFKVFDPALPELEPAYPQCFSRAAMGLGPMRCDGRACPGYDATQPEATSGGCALTDEAGASTPPPGWRFGASLGSKRWSRCMAEGCQLFEASREPAEERGRDRGATSAAHDAAARSMALLRRRAWADRR